MMYKESEIRKALAGLGTQSPFDIFLRETGERLLFTSAILNELKGNASPDRLQELNVEAYAPLLENAYERGLANPTKAATVFGEELGRFVSVFYYKNLLLVRAAFRGNALVIEQMIDHWLEAGFAGQSGFAVLMSERWSEVRLDLVEIMYRWTFDPGCSFYTDLALAVTPDDLSYLYRYGVRITENNFKTASFINSLPEDDIKLIVDTMVDAYIEGFKESGMDYTIKNSVALIMQAGYERIVPGLLAGFERYGLKMFVTHVQGTKFNRQAAYDHRFDYALSISEEIVDKEIAVNREVFNGMADVLHKYSGQVYLRVFGEPPFSPVLKPEACKADEEASAQFNKLMQGMQVIADEYMPGDEISFEIIAFPSPEIEGEFGEIFKDIVRLNTLSNKTYRPIQQAIIDAMDGAEYAHVLGSGSNETDLKVALCPIEDPVKQTIFENCLASVNVPLGEVFTSPMLKGTNGLLHVEESFLNGLRYDNIRLEFKDGYVSDWSSTNFDDPQRGKDYIKENLFFPHKTLPLGEFAIGTNTVVYAMALKHNILDLLPVLILEKMGPHFAVGDTCYSWSEDSQKPSPLTGKTMIAVDNEKTIQRKEDPSLAYTNRHTDVILPYSSLNSISVVRPGGMEVFIIKGGRFVLEGTEMLNDAIDEAHSYLQ
ncbi:leucyl aminopeptidase [Candidatus Fermentibacteria bacterium]|nr:MAG: leucyl aminopeptidase [Candidatus Fermentibacteria bacterium]